MKPALSLAAAVVAIGTVLCGTADADQRERSRDRNDGPARYDSRDDRRDQTRYRDPDDRRDGRYDHHNDRARNGYFRGRDVVVIREYYRPAYRPLPPGLARHYARSGFLPSGWARRMRPVPVYVERDMVRVPRGYRRGVIDGHVVVYNDRGFILDVAVLF